MSISIPGKTEHSRETVAVLGVISTITTSSGFNVYILDVATGGELSAQTSVAYDTMLYLFDATETQVAYNDDGGGGNSSLLVFTVAPGRYYLVLAGYGANFGTCDLTLSGNSGLALGSPAPVVIPPSNIKIGYANVIDKSTLVATGVSVNLPVDNLKTIARGQVFRGNMTTQTIECTFEKASLIGVIALWLPVQSWNSDNRFDVEIYNGASVVKTITGAIFSTFFTEITATKIIMTIRSATVFDLSRLFVGRFFEPTHNLEFGFSTKYKDLSTNERTEDGSLHIVKKAKYRTLSISLADITHADRAKLAQMIVQSGTQQDVFVSVFNGDAEALADFKRYDHEMFGVFDDGAEIALTSANRWNNKLVVNEL